MLGHRIESKWTWKRINNREWMHTTSKSSQIESVRVYMVVCCPIKAHVFRRLVVEWLLFSRISMWLILAYLRVRAKFFFYASSLFLSLSFARRFFLFLLGSVSIQFPIEFNFGVCFVLVLLFFECIRPSFSAQVVRIVRWVDLRSLRSFIRVLFEGVKSLSPSSNVISQLNQRLNNLSAIYFIFGSISATKWLKRWKKREREKKYNKREERLK